MTCEIHDVAERASHLVLGFQCPVNHIGLLQLGEITLLFFSSFLLFAPLQNTSLNYKSTAGS